MIARADPPVVPDPYDALLLSLLDKRSVMRAMRDTLMEQAGIRTAGDVLERCRTHAALVARQLSGDIHA